MKKYLKFKNNKLWFFYVALGMVYYYLMVYISLPISNFLDVPHTWNRKVWIVLVSLIIILLALHNKKKYNENFFAHCIRAGLITFLTATLWATISLFFFSPNFLVGF